MESAPGELVVERRGAYDVVVARPGDVVHIGRVDRTGRVSNDYRDLILARERGVPEGGAVLVLGAGPGGFLRQLALMRPDVRIDAADSDPRMFRLARDHFGLSESETLRFFVDDAVGLVAGERLRRDYDLIVLDVYEASAVPPSVATSAFVEALADRLRPGGALVANVLGTTAALLPHVVHLASSSLRLLAEIRRCFEGVSATTSGLNLVVFAERGALEPSPCAPCADPELRRHLELRLRFGRERLASRAARVEDGGPELDALALADAGVRGFVRSVEGESPEVASRVGESWELRRRGRPAESVVATLFAVASASAEASPVARRFLTAWLGGVYDDLVLATGAGPPIVRDRLAELESRAPDAAARGWLRFCRAEIDRLDLRLAEASGTYENLAKSSPGLLF